MKTLFFLALLSGVNPVLPIKNEGSGIVILSSNEVDSVGFQLTIKDPFTIHVTLSGVHEELTSLSVVDMRGKTFFYKLIETPNSEWNIDLSDLPKGAYYVKLNLNSEIRLKLIRVEE